MGMSKILPGLYLGSLHDSKDRKQLAANNVTHVVSVHDYAKPLLPELTYLCIVASDRADQDLMRHFGQVNDFIHEARLNNGTVLVHCMLGVSRSVTLVAAYLMTLSRLCWREALNAVRGTRRGANPNLGFKKQLRIFEAEHLNESERPRFRSKFPISADPYDDLAEIQQLLVKYQRYIYLGDKLEQEEEAWLVNRLSDAVKLTTPQDRDRGVPTTKTIAAASSLPSDLYCSIGATANAQDDYLSDFKPITSSLKQPHQTLPNSNSNSVTHTSAQGQITLARSTNPILCQPSPTPAKSIVVTRTDNHCDSASITTANIHNPKLADCFKLEKPTAGATYNQRSSRDGLPLKPEPTVPAYLPTLVHPASGPPVPHPTHSSSSNGCLGSGGEKGCQGDAASRTWNKDQNHHCESPRSSHTVGQTNDMMTREDAKMANGHARGGHLPRAKHAESINPAANSSKPVANGSQHCAKTKPKNSGHSGKPVGPDAMTAEEHEHWRKDRIRETGLSSPVQLDPRDSKLGSMLSGLKLSRNGGTQLKNLKNSPAAGQGDSLKKGIPQQPQHNGHVRGKSSEMKKSGTDAAHHGRSHRPPRATPSFACSALGRPPPPPSCPPPALDEEIPLIDSVEPPENLWHGSQVLFDNKYIYTGQSIRKLSQTGSVVFGPVVKDRNQGLEVVSGGTLKGNEAMDASLSMQRSTVGHI